MRHVACTVILALLIIIAFLLSACAGGPTPERAPTPMTAAMRIVLVTRSPNMPTATPLPPETSVLMQQPAPINTTASTPASTNEAVPISPSDAVVEAQVVEVIDGDTILVSIAGDVYTVSYLGVNIPADGSTLESGEPEATAKNRELVAGKAVRLQKDVFDTDGDGHLLRYVYTGDIMVNEELVRLGLLQVAHLSPDVKYGNLFLEKQMEAKAAGRGHWAVPAAGPAKRSTKAEPDPGAQADAAARPTPKEQRGAATQSAPKEQPGAAEQPAPKEQPAAKPPPPHKDPSSTKR